MLEAVTSSEALAAVAAGVGLVTLVGAAVALPWVLARLPADWLVRGPEPWPTTARGWLLRGGRNLLGGVLVVAGVAMLVLPGQGVLTILAGLVLVDVPGRKRVLVAVLRRPAVARGVAWIRERAEAPPLELPDDAR